MIENLAAIGYDNNNMHLAAYDWRLAFANLERRDQYFSKLKSTIELAYRLDNQRVVIIAHSMGKLCGTLQATFYITINTLVQCRCARYYLFPQVG